MKVTSLAYLLLILIALQSVLSVAKAESFHQVDPEHLAQVHELQGGDQPSIGKQNGDQPSGHNPADCHHCGHCQGSHFQWAYTSMTLGVLAFNDVKAYYYRPTVIEGPASRLLRPPIA